MSAYSYKLDNKSGVFNDHFIRLMFIASRCFFPHSAVCVGLPPGAKWCKRLREELRDVVRTEKKYMAHILFKSSTIWTAFEWRKFGSSFGQLLETIRVSMGCDWLPCDKVCLFICLQIVNFWRRMIWAVVKYQR